MKNLKSIFAIGMLALVTACGTTNKTTSDTSNTSIRRGDTPTSRTSTNTATTTNANRSTNVSGTRGNSNMQQKSAEEMKASTAANEAYKQKMATDLSFTEAQMNSYETNWNAENAKWLRTHRNKEMTLYERVETQDKIFKSILNQSDFAKYQAWVRDNPEKI